MKLAKPALVASTNPLLIGTMLSIPVFAVLSAVVPVGIGIFGTLARGAPTLFWAYMLAVFGAFLPRVWRSVAAIASTILLVSVLLAAGVNTLLIQRWLRLPIETRAVRTPYGKQATEFWQLDSQPLPPTALRYGRSL
ncbi:hypothetical protein [Verrucomicrobium sp. 3C]|uniref:hypothetical protein n=1 Tax=Verrucomicrobium sp. 3C TaxID=1134055 RepID=UPI00036A6347|nr:hypothetical protein [Verrucomicrobium sp. 3C]